MQGEPENIMPPAPL